jgi:GntR family transcriptional regulator, transcriptional repressor for pyruvate dehydrogenase complex
MPTSRGEPGELSPVAPARLYELLAERLVEHVESEGLQPGDRLPAERALAALFGVSRSSVRQALVSLQVQGVVTVRHGGGVFLARPPRRDPLRGLWERQERLCDIYPVREALEVKIAELAAVRRLDEDCRLLDRALDDMARDIDGGGIGAHADAAFHSAVTLAAHNPVMVDLMAYVSDHVWESRIESLSQDGRPPLSLAGHRSIAEAITRGDAPGAGQAMREHLTLVASASQTSNGRTRATGSA